ncbi:MAG: tRNA (adenosine(37)-N6)-threonylcarbamoyltransferase complex dimerization subunit type 1 TsaB [Lachnospiraceae bacterium]|nr:tRNA (adenosine(37)-N6)-threonylcarbamoyltransferase complex dimerization subunit type 1 TsaB [Lachnospiraceae bacterium]
MKILALDSSGLVASVAVVEDETLIGEYSVNYKKTHSQTLLPMLDTLAKMIDLDLQTIDAIAVAEGPGSFTGLRIGSATAKGLGFALKKPLIGIPTVDGLAYQLAGSKNLVCPIMDARRQQTYTGVYRFLKQSDMEILLPQCAIGIDELVEKLNAMGQAVTFLGDGVPVFKEYLKENLTVEYDFAAPHQSRQSAGAVAALAMQYMADGKTVDAADFRPVYLRLSQAERERLEAEKREEAEKRAAGEQ